MSASRAVAMISIVLFAPACDDDPATVGNSTGTIAPLNTVVTTVISTTQATVSTGVTRAESSRRWIIDAIAVVRENAFYSERIDWPARIELAESRATSDRGPADMYRFLETVLFDLGDRHSNFRTPQQAAALDLDLNQELVTSAPAAIAAPDNIGYVSIPAVRALPNTRESHGYAQMAIDSLSSIEACGWIVDLRGNRGGSLPPMLQAVSPLLGPGTRIVYQDRLGQDAGFAVGDDYAIDPFGSSSEDIETSPPPNVPPADLAADLASAPVAVLLDRFTASAAEGAKYEQSIEPDIPIEQPAPDGLMDQTGTYSPTDATSLAARDWIMEQPACG